MDATEFAALVKKKDELERLVKRHTLTIKVLDADFYLAGHYWREDQKNRQFWSRVVIRSLCANIEARLFVFRSMALQMAQVAKVAFTEKEMETLTEKKTRVQNGIQTTTNKYLPIRDSLKESFRLFAKSTGTTFVLDTGAKGYQALLDTFDVRDGLMHPKDIFGLEVRDTDIANAEDGIDWFSREDKRVQDETQAHTDAAVKAEKEKLAKQQGGASNAASGATAP